MIKVALVNPLDGSAATIGTEGVIPVVIHPHPPFNDKTNYIPFVQYLTDDGTSDGSRDMRVSGSLADPVEFSIKADPFCDIYIKSLSIVIADAGATLNNFGSISALTNGLQFIYKSQTLGDVIITDSLKSNFDFVQLAGGVPSFGDGNTAFKANNVVGSSEAFIPFLDLAKVFGTPYGIKLAKASLDRIAFTVRDNTTAVDRFDILAYGGSLIEPSQKE